MASLPPTIRLAQMPDFNSLALFDPNAPSITDMIQHITEVTVNMHHSDRIKIPMAIKPNVTATNATANTFITNTTTATSTYSGDTHWYEDQLRYSHKEITRDDIIRALQSGLVTIEALGNLNIRRGSKLNLPDGCIIDIKQDGNFEISDNEAKVIYKANRNREFNQYINASDLLESFIQDAGKAGAKQNEMLNVPIEIFINWLIHKAAEQDGDPIPQNVKLLEQDVKELKHPKCKQCGRFIKKSSPAEFCNGDHYQKYLEK